jgi:phage FluMu gp28-like protein
MPESIPGRINRYFEYLDKQRKRDENNGKPLTEESDVVEFFRHLGFKPTPYQEKLLRDKSKLILARWSRQSGKSLVMAVVALFNALRQRDFRAAIVAPSLRQSRKLIDKIDRLISRLGVDVLEGLPRKGRLAFRNGSVIEALPNNPDTIRGETLNMVVADEFAYIEHDKELYDAIIFTLSTTNGPFFATSTPGSRDTLFHGMATDDEIFGDFSRHHVSYREALKPNGPIDPEFLERIRKQYQTDPGRWRREMEAEFADDEDAYLPQELIESCILEGIETFTREDVIEGKVTKTGKFFVGTDLGLKVDRSSVVVIDKQAPDLYVKHVTAFPQGMVFSEVTGYLNLLNQKLQEVSRIYIDETGLGGFFVQDAIKTGLKNALGIYLSLPEKQKIMDILKRTMQDGHLHIPRDPELMNEMSNERYELSKTGQLQFSHPAGTHDDRLWALALAVYAARLEVPKWQYFAFTTRNPNYIGPSFDLRRPRRGVGPISTSRPGDPPWTIANNQPWTIRRW